MKKTLALLIGIMLSAGYADAADGISGTWMTGTGADTKTFVFKVKGDTFTGLVCGQCDDPASVFRIEDGKLDGAERMTFVVRYDAGPDAARLGPHRARVSGTLAANQLTLRTQRENSSEAPVTSVLKRVVENAVSVAPKSWTMKAFTSSAATGVKGNGSPIDGKWVANGRVAQQTFVLKVRDDNTLWGLVCGPCHPDGVFMIDDGKIEGDQVIFYINHIDTPPSATQTSLRRNVMRGTLLGNVMKFKWVREGAEDQPGGEMILIGPIR